jgi:septum formation protein
MKLILASKSPRRKQILSEFGYSFDIVTTDQKEVVFLGDPIHTAIENAYLKAVAVYKELKGNVVVLGADTVVCLGDKILGKPRDKSDAKETLKSLSSKTHQVVTGYAVIGKDLCVKDCAISEVTFNQLSSELIDEYVKSGSPLDKAGSYGIQDDFPLVKSYTGELNNIIGLPIEDIKPILDKALKE